jgi:hypothetical protein
VAGKTTKKREDIVKDTCGFTFIAAETKMRSLIWMNTTTMIRVAGAIDFLYSSIIVLNVTKCIEAVFNKLTAGRDPAFAAFGVKECKVA